MKKIRMLRNAVPDEIRTKDGQFVVQFQYQIGKSYIVSNEKAKTLYKQRYEFDNERMEKYVKVRWAKVVNDYGLYFGHSRHTYNRNGVSKLYGKKIDRIRWTREGIISYLEKKPMGATISDIKRATGISDKNIWVCLTSQIEKGEITMIDYGSVQVFLKKKKEHNEDVAKVDAEIFRQELEKKEE